MKLYLTLDYIEEHPEGPAAVPRLRGPQRGVLPVLAAGVPLMIDFDKPVALSLEAPVLVEQNRVRHAAHYQYGAGGHDLDRWVVRSQQRPTREQLAELGMPNDAEYHVGFVDVGTSRQHWVYVARRPMSDGTCESCRSASVVKLYLTHRGEPEMARLVLDDGAIVLCLTTRCPRTGDVAHRDWQPGYPGDEIADVAECGTPDGYESGEAMRAAYEASWPELRRCDPPELTDRRPA